jgi:hypothetical protein
MDARSSLPLQEECGPRDIFFFVLLVAMQPLATPPAAAAPARTIAQLEAPESSWTPTGSLAIARFGATAVLLYSGKVLVIGGVQRPTPAAPPEASVELFNPASGMWTSAGTFTTYPGTSATLLGDGRSLATANHRANFYDPRSGTWTPAAVSSTGQNRETALRLTGGRVFILGTTSFDVHGNGMQALAFRNAAELYDLATAAWTPTGSMSQPRRDHTATLLLGGRVLIVGGTTSTDEEVSRTGISAVEKTTELYTPVSLSTQSIPQMGTGGGTGQTHPRRATFAGSY